MPFTFIATKPKRFQFDVNTAKLVNNTVKAGVAAAVGSWAGFASALFASVSFRESNNQEKVYLLLQKALQKLLKSYKKQYNLTDDFLIHCLYSLHVNAPPSIELNTSDISQSQWAKSCKDYILDLLGTTDANYDAINSHFLLDLCGCLNQVRGSDEQYESAFQSAIVVLSTFKANPLNVYNPSDKPHIREATVDSNPANWLHFGKQQIDLVGREDWLNASKDFFASRTPGLQWWTIAGQGGIGKSRAALTALNDLDAYWYYGFVTDAQALLEQLNTWQCELPTAIVIDYASSKGDLLPKIITQLAEKANTHAIRLLLLDRDTTQPWFQELVTNPEIKHYQYAPVYLLQALTGQQQIQTVNAFLTAMQSSVLIDENADDSFAEHLNKITNQGVPLFLGFCAYTIYQQQSLDQLRAWSQDNLLASLYDREQLRLRQHLPVGSPHLQRLNELIALATFCGGFSDERYAQHKALINQALSQSTEAETQDNLWAEVKALINPTGLIEPDIYGEYAVLKTLSPEVSISVGYQTNDQASPQVSLQVNRGVAEYAEPRPCLNHWLALLVLNKRAFGYVEQLLRYFNDYSEYLHYPVWLDRLFQQFEEGALNADTLRIERQLQVALYVEVTGKATHLNTLNQLHQNQKTLVHTTTVKYEFLELIRAMYYVNVISGFGSQNQLDDMQAALDQLQLLANDWPQVVEIQTLLAQGLVNVISDFGSHNQLDDMQAALDQLQSLANDWPGVVEIQTALAQGLFNVISNFGSHNQLDDMQAALDQLQSLANDWPEVVEIQTLLAKGLVNAIHHFGSHNQFDDMQAALDQLQTLANDWPDVVEIQTLLAEGLVNAISGFGSQGQLDDMEAALQQLQTLANDWPEVVEIHTQLAKGLVNAISGFGSQGQLDDMEAALDQLQLLANDWPEVVEIQTELAKSLFNVISNLGSQGQLDDMQAALDQLQPLAHDWPDVVEIQTLLAEGLVNAINYFGNQNQFDDMEAALDQLQPLANDWPDVVEIQTQLAMGLANVIIGFDSQDQLDDMEAALDQLQLLANDWPEVVEIQIWLAKGLAIIISDFGRQGQLDDMQAALDQLQTLADDYSRQISIQVVYVYGLIATENETLARSVFAAVKHQREQVDDDFLPIFDLLSEAFSD